MFEYYPEMKGHFEQKMRINLDFTWVRWTRIYSARSARSGEEVSPKESRQCMESVKVGYTCTENLEEAIAIFYEFIEIYGTLPPLQRNCQSLLHVLSLTPVIIVI